MHSYSLTHVSDRALLHSLAALVARERITTAEILAHIAEVDARRLYVPAGYSSMHAYCVDELGLSEDAAYKRIQAARAARQFPGLFAAVAEGRLHLAAMCLLAPHPTVENSGELVEAAAHRRKAEIEELLARRFGTPETPAVVRAMPANVSPTIPQLAPGQVDGISTGHESRQRYLLQLNVDKSTHDKLRYAQALLSHALPSGDVAQVLDRALDLLITQLEKRKFGAPTGPSSRSSGKHRASTGRRQVPAQVRRAVWERDKGQCTFASTDGKRCAARRFLEFDHVEPVARGGTASVDGMRLRCRAHNQYEAERVFGAEFMRHKRQKAQTSSRSTVSSAAARACAEVREQTQDVLSGLRNLGCRAHEARRAADFSATLREATLEDRMRAALRFLSDRAVQRRQAVIVRSG